MAYKSAAPTWRVLVVDDDIALLEATRLLLETLGYQVWAASSGSAALTLAQQISPSLVFLDLQMPGLDGFETARCLRQTHGEEVILVAYTGLHDKATRQRLQSAGFNHFLPKPATGRTIRSLLTDQLPITH